MIRSKRKAGSFDLASSVSHHMSSPFRSSDNPINPQAVMAVLEDTEKDIQQVPLVDALINERGHGVSKELQFTPYGLSAACSRIGLPTKLVNDISKTNPKLASEVFNHCVRSKGHDFQAVVHKGHIEGVVSNNYRRLPNLETVSTLLDKGGNIQSFHMEGLRMRMTTMKRESFAEVQRGDIVGTGMELRNAEDGRWAFDLNLFMLRLVCTNGMISQVGNISGYMQHRGNIREKAATLITRADSGSNDLLHAVRKSLTVQLDQPKIKEIRDDVAEHFDSLTWGNTVADNIPKEASRWQRNTPVLFDAWNAVTGLHTECSHNLDRLVELQSYSRGILDLASTN